jgi:ABC-type uncharacterized transport system permease subunit
VIGLLLLFATLGYAGAGILYVAWSLRHQEPLRRGGLLMAVIATLVAGVAAAMVLASSETQALPTPTRVLVLATAAASGMAFLFRLDRGQPLMGTVLYPLSAAVMLASYASAMGMSGQDTAATVSAFTALHIGATLLGFLMLVPAYVLSVLFLDQEHRLKAKRPGGTRRPSLLTLEKNAWRLLYAGFPLLTAGIVLGIVWQGSERMTLRPQHVLAAASWCVYAFAIYRRVRTGWRGPRAALSLMTAFVGTLGAVLMYAMR